MTEEDASFSDGDGAPLRLYAREPADLEVISALTQDAVFILSDLKFDRRRRQFALLINRFRWEDAEEASRQSRPFERVRSVLLIEDVLQVLSQGVDKSETDIVLALLSLTFEPNESGAGRLLLTLAGDGAIAIDVETVEVSLTDVTRPHLALSSREPRHS